MKLNRKLWTAALAVAMTTPSAMAAQDTAGMHYTSAAEGFYASIRLRYVSNGGKEDGGANLENSSSRIGVRGTNDLGGGLEGFYQYEMLVNTDQGEGVGTRLGHVGLRGDFGSVVAGAFWPDTYNWVYGSTDVANRSSGNFTGGFGQYRTSKSLQYTTPDLNGFRGAFLIQADSSRDGEGKVNSERVVAIDNHVESTVTMAVLPSSPPVVGDPAQWTYMAVTTNVVNSPEKVKNSKDDTGIDHWSLAAAYDIAGFSMGFSYSVYPDRIAELGSGYTKQLMEMAKYEAKRLTLSQDLETHGSFKTKKDDLSAWAIKLGYSQDNWYVNSWYGEQSTGDVGGYNPPHREADDPEDTHFVTSFGDTEVFSIAGGISVDKVAVYAVYENKEHDFFADKYDAEGKSSSDGKVDTHIRGDDSYYTLGVQYTLGSNSWTWVEYAGRDLDSSESDDDDFSIGLGHSF